MRFAVSFNGYKAKDEVEAKNDPRHVSLISTLFSSSADSKVTHNHIQAHKCEQEDWD